MSERVSLECPRFGRLELDAESLLRFDGLPGFPEARRFAIVRHDSESLFAWLVCADDPELGFVVTDPWHFFPDYEPSLEPAHLSAVGASDDSSLDLLVIADVSGGTVHLNLAAPVLVNGTSRRAAQVILESGGHSIRQPVVPEKPPAPDGAS